MVASRLTKQRKERRGTKKPHDIITSPDHAHDPAASRKTVHTHTTYSHTLEVMQLTHTQTHPHTHTLCKTKYKHRLTSTKTSAFDISQNPHVLAVPKPKRQSWQKCLIFILIMLFQKHLTAVGQYCVFVLLTQLDLAAHQVIESSSTLQKEQEDGQQKQADRQACSKLNDNQFTAMMRRENCHRHNQKTWLHRLFVAGHAQTRSHTHSQAHTLTALTHLPKTCTHYFFALITPIQLHDLLPVRRRAANSIR